MPSDGHASTPGTGTRLLAQDVRVACRRLWASKDFAAIAVLLLAPGIGANAAVVSVVDPLLMQALPVPHPDRLVLLHSAGTLQVQRVHRPRVTQETRKSRTRAGRSPSGESRRP